MTKSTRKRAYDLVFALAFENPGLVALPKKSKTGKIGISEGILQ